MIIRGKADGEVAHPAEGLALWRLLGAKECGAKRVACELTEFDPGAVHIVHRHPNAEQIHFLVSGSGVRLGPDGERVRQQEGEVALIPAGEWHGFENDTDEPIIVFSAFGGVAGPEEAGYEERGSDGT